MLYVKYAVVVQFQVGLIRSSHKYLDALPVIFFSEPVRTNAINVAQNVLEFFQVIIRWKVARKEDNRKHTLLNWNSPSWVMEAVRFRLSALKGTW